MLRPLSLISSRWLLAASFVSLCLTGAVAPAYAANLLPGFSESLFAQNLTQPTRIDFAPDGKLFVLEKTGAVRVVENGTPLSTPFASLTVNTAGERGLLGIAFDPDYARNNYVYVYHTVPAPAGGVPHNRVTRFTASGDTALAGSATTILDLEGLNATNHNGGDIHFGADKKLYVAVGENAVPSNAQSLNTRLGKILRINSDGTIPTDNPFFNAATGDNRAIWAYGLRNPYSFSFQPGTSTMFINDVGQDTWEEINRGKAGANYGWPTTEGPTNDPRFTTPLLAYLHGAGDNLGNSILGSAFYNPTRNQFPAAYRGDYFYGDFVNGWIRSLDVTTNTPSLFATQINGLVDLKVGPDGALYYVSLFNGTVSRVQSNIAAVAPEPATLALLLPAFLYFLQRRKRRNCGEPTKG